MRVPAGLMPLRHRDFALYWIAQVISQSGTFIEMTATAYLLYAITSSPLLLGLGGLARAVPVLAFTLFAVALPAFSGRKRLRVGTEGRHRRTSSHYEQLVVTGQIQFWHI